MADQTYSCDILIAGAGFAGALTALLLHKRGFSVCLVEKGRHPRFAIGESSTPIADLLLRDLSTRYDLPWLYPFSRYGSWQETHPDVVCGIKRGFSYFKHYPGQAFSTDAVHSQELLVAASTSDEVSDTNWLRADFDAFLVEKVKEAGIAYFDLTELTAAERGAEWTFRAERGGGRATDERSGHDRATDGAPLTITAAFFIDATGGGALLDGLLGVASSAQGFDTDSYGLFSHFDDLPRWMDVLNKAHIPTDDFPYDPDHSALHHVLDEGWIWVLRFNDRRTSVGFALDRRKTPVGSEQPQERWNRLLQKYPSVGGLLDGVAFSAVPGKLIQSGRLQRKTERCVGAGWAALPHTAGFVDPLFSSGIAHSLTGIRRLVGTLEQYWGDGAVLERVLKGYEEAVFTELRLIDKLVAGCYLTMPHFGLFQAWSMLYFAATITCEQRHLRGEGGGYEGAGYFLGADNPAIQAMVGDCWAELMRICRDGLVQPAPTEIQRFTDLVRKKIAPFNSAGLMEPGSGNMYRHTVAALE
jgi:tetracycline 7-halogenase / FADH2 O2-dependent halogenase